MKGFISDCGLRAENLPHHMKTQNRWNYAKKSSGGVASSGRVYGIGQSVVLQKRSCIKSDDGQHLSDTRRV
jgi:hypothetical protein